MSVVLVQVVLTPLKTPTVHVESAAHVLHPGAFPEAENVPAAHYTYEER